MNATQTEQSEVLSTDDTGRALNVALVELEQARARIATGGANTRKAYEAAEWTVKEATIRHEEAQRREAAESARAAEQEHDRKLARFDELRAFIHRGYLAELRPVLETIAARIVSLDQDDLTAFYATLAKVQTAAGEARRLAVELTELTEGKNIDVFQETVLDAPARRAEFAAVDAVRALVSARLEEQGGRRAVAEFTKRVARDEHTRFFDLPRT
jgi:hypothetical protein